MVLRFPRRDDYGLAVLPDGRILRIGGIIPLTGGLEINEVAFFDPKTRRWTPGPSLNAARRGAFVLRLPEGKIAVVGGASQLEVFDPSRQVWEAGAKLPYGFGAAPPVFAALDDGHVIGIAHERAIIWTPGDAEWKPLTTVTGKRAFFSLVPIEGGLLIAGGGENGHMSEFLRLRL